MPPSCAAMRSRRGAPVAGQQGHLEAVGAQLPNGLLGIGAQPILDPQTDHLDAVDGAMHPGAPSGAPRCPPVPFIVMMPSRPRTSPRRQSLGGAANRRCR
jgi:hypothetical protein